MRREGCMLPPILLTSTQEQISGEAVKESLESTATNEEDYKNIPRPSI